VRRLNAAVFLRRSARLTRHAICGRLVAGLATPAWAQKPPADLTTTSLVELINIQATSASKKEQKLSQSAASIYVITQEDIRRSELTSLQELLRMVPGLDVARIDGNKWAVSARGFNDRFANQLLVLIDGRSVNSPETSGVYWEALDTLLEDVERIEVIRGPGGTLWGANAVNGVINIITKHTKDIGGVVRQRLPAAADRTQAGHRSRRVQGRGAGGAHLERGGG